MYYIYFAKSLKNGKIYVGSTSKTPEIRLKEHNSGCNAWSKQNRPLKLLYYENYFCEEDARLKERFYKFGFGRIIKGLIAKYLGS